MSIPETIYRIKNPDDLIEGNRPEDFYGVEYRQLLIKGDPESISGSGWILEVNQGWWHSVDKVAKHHQNLLRAPYDSYEEAQAAQNDQLEALVSEGYIHSFSL